MASLRELRRKIRSVKSTQQITRAMKMVAAARLNRAQNRILSARPFADKMEGLLHELAHIAQTESDGGGTHSAFFKRRETARIDLVLVTADRGLCGAFNASLIRRAVRFLRDHERDDVRLWLVGKKGRDFFRRLSVKREKEYVGFFQRLTYGDAEILGDDLIETFLSTDTSSVVILYNEFKSRIQQRLVIRDLLPIPRIDDVKARRDFLYEPSREEILEGLLPRYLKAQIYRILLESQAAELAARMTAMDSATNNASDLIYSLTLNMNKVRQAGITKEISEIVGGAEALQA